MNELARIGQLANGRACTRALERANHSRREKFENFLFTSQFVLLYWGKKMAIISLATSQKFDLSSLSSYDHDSNPIVFFLFCFVGKFEACHDVLATCTHQLNSVQSNTFCKIFIPFSK